MTATDLIKHHLTRSPLIAAALYVGLLTALATMTWGAIADVLERRAEVTAARDTLARMEGRKPAPAHRPNNAADDSAITPPGSACLEGPTVTVAGAALLQRIAVAVTKVGGGILSSQVELQGPQSKVGFIGVIASCELDQPALQQLLYDLEAGMPFLFVEQLAVQAPVAVSGAREGRLRVQLTVYGQWQGEK
jgi:general secretion pathway protein M